jgi:predicted glycoside hydrolase/deacetylase ChbG (UPF0249 family)
MIGLPNHDKSHERIESASKITLMIVQVKEELLKQVARYTELMGAPPVYIDGHQHAHMIPGNHIFG